MKQWFRTFLLLLLTAAVLLALFTIGAAVALILLGIGIIASLYVWLKNKGIIEQSPAEHSYPSNEIIDAEYEVIEEEEKK